MKAWLLSVACFLVLASCGGHDDSPTAPIFGGSTALGADKLVFDSDRSAAGNREIYLMKSDGSGVQQLTTDTHYENWWPRISPDRKKILFYRRPAGVQADDYQQASLWVMNADGSSVTLLRAQGADGWTLQGHGEWSPDGNHIAMFGSVGATLQIFVTDASGKSPVQYTNRPGINTDVSWSPDGSKLLFNGCPLPPVTCTPAHYEIYVMNAVALSSPVALTNDGLADYDPYFSPDGSTIAWLTTTNPAAFSGIGSWGIRMANADGSNLRTLIDDGNINSKPAWSLDGQTLFFHRMELAPLVEAKFGVFRINANGTGLTRLTPVGSGVNEFPSN
jgi:TolB protein